MIINNNAINSKLNIIRIPAEFMKISTRKSNEWIGLGNNNKSIPAVSKLVKKKVKKRLVDNIIIIK